MGIFEDIPMVIYSLFAKFGTDGSMVVHHVIVCVFISVLLLSIILVFGLYVYVSMRKSWIPLIFSEINFLSLSNIVCVDVHVGAIFMD